MKYLEWNHLLSNYFFNSSKAGKEVLLYITQGEISALGMRAFGFTTPEEAWEDYCMALRTGFPETSSKSSFIEKFNVINDKWLQYQKWIFELGCKDPLQIDGVSLYSREGIVPPFYVAFIAALIVPLTDKLEEIRANAYYPRLNRFLKDNKIANKPVTSMPFTCDIWKNLEEWSSINYQTDIGFFRKRSLGNPQWIHVNKVFSQCLLTPQNIRDMPKLFAAAELAPATLLTQENILDIVMKHGQAALGLPAKVLTLAGEKDNDLGKLVLEIIRREYAEWEGDIDEYEDGKIKSKWIMAKLLSSFTVDAVNSEFNHQYYLYSKNDYPEDLHMLGEDIPHLTHGFSKPLRILFKTSINGEDNANKWKAFSNNRELVLYKNGAYVGLESDVWIEAEEVSKASAMFLLCTETKKESVEKWGTHFKPGNFKRRKMDNLPEGFLLYKFQHPTEEHPVEPALKFPSNKRIELIGGLKLNNREYLKGNLPKMYLHGAEGSEQLWLEYEGTDMRIQLVKNTAVPEEYYMPGNMPCDQSFTFKLDEGQLAGYQLQYKVITPSIDPSLIEEGSLTKRNKYGEVASSEVIEYVQGSNTVYTNWQHQLGWQFHFFSSMYTAQPFSDVPAIVNMTSGNTLLEYLTCLKDIRFADFSNAFDHLATTGRLWPADENPKWIKQSAIQLYDFLGFLDYDYLLDKIVINKPQLILIPSMSSVVAILIGARTENSLQQIFQRAFELQINTEVAPQFLQHAKHLLPDVIKLTPAFCSNAYQATAKLEALASQTGLTFHRVSPLTPPPKIIQFGLQDFASSLNEYKIHMLANSRVESQDYDWARKVFNIDTFKFENMDGEIDKQLALVKYVIKYERFYRLWFKGECYKVDGAWGIYLMASERERKIISYAEDKKVLIVPANAQLPRLISESLMLLSGQAPLFKRRPVAGKDLPCQLFQNVPKLFAENLFKKFNQQIQLTTL